MALNVEVIQLSSDDESVRINDPHFYYSFEKTITASQAESTKLHVPAEFVRSALVYRRHYYLLEDEDDKQWSIHLSWSDRSKFECDITSGCDDFKKYKNLREGSIICIGGPGKKGQHNLFQVLVSSKTISSL